jgi:hypothetical protein
VTLTLDSILLGSTLVFDGASLAASTIAALLLVALALTQSVSLRRSIAARITFALAGIAMLLQCLAGEMLLFLAAGAVLGYALLALGLTGPRRLTRQHAIAAAALLVAGDLALLELAMLLAKSGAARTFADAGGTLAAVRGDPLAEFCLVLGIGSRLGLPALCLRAGQESRARLALLPGWLLLAAGAVAGAVRLSCAGDFAVSCAAPLGSVLWWVPVLALIAWLLPRWIPALLTAAGRLGSATESVRDATLHRLQAAGKAATDSRGTVLQAESLLTRWPVALGAAMLVAVAVAATLFLAG